MYTQMFPLSIMNHMEYNFPTLMDCLHLIVTEGMSHTDRLMEITPVQKASVWG